MRPEREAGQEQTPSNCAAAVFPGFERIVFRSPEEFAVLAERFLDDDDYRRRVCDDLRRVVLRDCTYTGVVRSVVDAFGKQIAAQAAALLSPVS